MRRKGSEESKSRRVEESAILARVEAALSTLARVERAPELGEELRGRIAGRRVGGLRWAWVGAGAVAAIAIVVAVAVWPRGGGEVMRSGRQEAQAVGVGVRVTEVEARAQRKSAGRPGDRAPKTAPAGVPTNERHIPGPTRGVRHGGDAETSPPLRLRSGQAYRTAVAPRTGLPQEQEQAAFAEAPSERDTPAGPVGGVILVLGRPEPVLPSGSYYAEVTLADGTRTVREQTVERDAAGRPQMVQISYEQIEPSAASAQQGG